MKEKKKWFLKEVMQEIKSREAKQFVSAELENHIKHSKKSFLKKGLTELEAEEEAIKQMGNPHNLGKKMNVLHRPRVDWIMLGLLFLALGFGFLPMFVVESVNILSSIGNKIIMVLFGAAILLSLMFLDYRHFGRFKWLYFGLGTATLLVLHFFPSSYINGYPILELGPININSLHVMPFYLLFWASFLSEKQISIWKSFLLFFTVSAVLLSIGGISTFVMHSVMFIAMALCSTLSTKKILTTIAAVLVLGTGSLLMLVPKMQSYQIERILAFLNPEQYSDSSGFMYIFAKEMLGAGGWFGNNDKTKAFPEALTDFIFVSITYHFGWIVSGIVVLCLVLILTKMTVSLKNIKEPFGKILITGGVALFSFQVIYNIGMIFGLVPMISMSLPLISYGFMPVLLSSVITGLFLSVYRRKNIISLG